MRENNKFIPELKIIFKILKELTTYFLTFYMIISKKKIILAIKIKGF